MILGSGRSPGEGVGYPTPVFLGFPVVSNRKESTCNAGDLDSVPGLGRSPGEGNCYSTGTATVQELHASILACRIPWTEEPGGLQSMGSQRAGHD